MLLKTVPTSIGEEPLMIAAAQLPSVLHYDSGETFLILKCSESLAPWQNL